MISTDDLVPLITKELSDSQAVYEQKFHSLHEAESIIREEMEECEEEMELIWASFSCLHKATREDSVSQFNSSANKLYDSATRLALEAIQLAAMCRKTLLS